MKNVKSIVMALIVILFTLSCFVSCNPNAGPKYDITIEITSESGTTIL